MDFSIALILAQDGITTGAVYAMLAVGLVLVFAVTRVIFIPQGELVAYGALTIAAMQSGQRPATGWLLLAMGVAVFAIDMWQFVARRGDAVSPKVLAQSALTNLVWPAVVLATIQLLPLQQIGLAGQIALTLAVVAPLGPMLYRLAFEPLAHASVLVLLIVSVAAHFVMLGLGLVMFGAEGVRSAAFSEARFAVGPLTLTGQGLSVIAASIVIMAALSVFFGNTVAGKALRATAVNRLGASLVGIEVARSGRLAFLLAGVIGAFSGILIGPITTLYYDSGFLIGLKGFVGAIIGGLASYPVAAGGALLVGLLEAYASFEASAYKEVLVFTLIVPVLVWRSFTSHTLLEDDES
ncbi:branched-chain amino acid ABC transporter permease [Caenimonas koreensis DSM 17982]|uniref:Branched-chain amino acid ABC transporter permease n=1 Tax=Caenimonas koreensis DSM 17982 TaxID=1121255 RepID=A0A844B7M2_9BURK|nr:branched-chain amino acid ABC transporter permease [Caenimonas koreensis]MRD49163.1 branched-chain amino acid ABC transporter permease [Caenimonas koreensis DSM 17982]